MANPIPVFARVEDIALTGRGTTLATSQRVLTGPIDFIQLVGTLSGNGVEVSVDGQTWSRLFPGEDMRGLGGASFVTVRSPRVEMGETMRLRYGLGSVEKDRQGRSFLDGAHPVPWSLQFDNATSLRPAPCFRNWTSGVPTFPLYSTGGLVEYDHIPFLKSLHAFNSNPAAAVWVHVLWYKDGLDANRPADSAHANLRFKVEAGADISRDFEAGIHPGRDTAGVLHKAPYVYVSSDAAGTAAIAALNQVDVVATFT